MYNVKNILYDVKYSSLAVLFVYTLVHSHWLTLVEPTDCPCIWEWFWTEPTDRHTHRRTDGAAAAASTSTSRTHAKQHSRISVVSENWRFLACSKEHCRHSIRSRCKNIPKYFFWNYQKNAKSHPVGQCCCSDAVVLCHRVLHYKINSSRTPFTSTWVFFNESINQRGFWKTQYWFFCRRISTEIGRNGICGKV